MLSKSLRHASYLSGQIVGAPPIKKSTIFLNWDSTINGTHVCDRWNPLPMIGMNDVNDPNMGSINFDRS